MDNPASKSTNPYQSPRKLEAAPADESVRCSFCERPYTETGTLIVDRAEKSYLCLACATTAQTALEMRKPLSLAKQIFAMVAVTGTVALVVWDVFFSAEPTLSIFQLALLIAFLASSFVFFELLLPRWSRRIR